MHGAVNDLDVDAAWRCLRGRLAVQHVALKGQAVCRHARLPRSSLDARRCSQTANSRRAIAGLLYSNSSKMQEGCLTGVCASVQHRIGAHALHRQEGSAAPLCLASPAAQQTGRLKGGRSPPAKTLLAALQPPMPSAAPAARAGHEPRPSGLAMTHTPAAMYREPTRMSQDRMSIIKIKAMAPVHMLQGKGLPVQAFHPRLLCSELEAVGGGTNACLLAVVSGS